MATYSKAKLTISVVNSNNYSQKVLESINFDLNNIDEISKKEYDAFLNHGKNVEQVKITLLNVREYGLVILLSSKKQITSEKVSPSNPFTLFEEIDKESFLLSKLEIF